MSGQIVIETKTLKNSIPVINSGHLKRKSLSRSGINIKLGNIDKKMNVPTPLTGIANSQNSSENFNYDFSAIPVRQSALPVIQAKLTTGQPNDKYEQEADRVADQVMRMPWTQVQRYSEDGGGLQMNAHQTSFKNIPLDIGGGDVSTLQPSVKPLCTGGRALSEPERNYFEPRINADFSNVRLHTDSEAERSASTIGARAFTIGNHIALARGEYDFHSRQGKQLMAHELTHVVQQTMATSQLVPFSSGLTENLQGKKTDTVTSDVLPRQETLVKSVTPVPMLQCQEHELRLRTPTTLQLPQRRPFSLYPLGGVPRYRLDILNLQGIRSIRPLVPLAPPPSPLPSSSTSTSSSSEEEASSIWEFKFELDVDEDSPLGRSLARQEHFFSVMSGEEAGGTALGLELINTAVNVLISTPEGVALRERLGLSNVTLILNPVRGEFVIGARLRFEFDLDGWMR